MDKPTTSENFERAFLRLQRVVEAVEGRREDITIRYGGRLSDTKKNVWHVMVKGHDFTGPTVREALDRMANVYVDRLEHHEAEVKTALAGIQDDLSTLRDLTK